MANVEINDLTSKTTPVGTDELEIQETGGGSSKKITLSNLVTNYLDDEYSLTAEENIPIGSLSSELDEIPSTADRFALYDNDATAVKYVDGTYMGLPATTSQVEAGSNSTLSVSPANFRYHDSAVKVWVEVAFSTGTPSVQGTAEGVSSLTDIAKGQTRVNFSTTSDGADFCSLASHSDLVQITTPVQIVATQSTGSFTVLTYDQNAADYEDIDFCAAALYRY